MGEAGALEIFEPETFDFVFMSDALLFYFIPVVKREKPDIRVLLDEIGRVLKPEGVFISLEPHAVFYMLPWLGSEDYPFCVITEYRQKSFGIVPTTSEVIQAFAKGGFTVVWMEELYAGTEIEGIDRRGYNFAKQFPIWQLFEAKKL